MTHPLCRGPAARRARLVLVALESREGPSTLTGLGGSDLFGQVPGGPPPGGPTGGDLTAPNLKPIISGFRASVGPNGRVTFTGTVTDDQAVEGMVVRISGSGFSVSATVLADGTFRVTTTVIGSLPTTATAITTDALGATSDEVQTMFTPTP
ncbi:MAG TPA: hypothetical protein VKD90_08415 [Gemmataceae bacterium]|nr:hypothetical protein [Gemmataceae bacterium]